MTSKMPPRSTPIKPSILGEPEPRWPIGKAWHQVGAWHAMPLRHWLPSTALPDDRTDAQDNRPRHRNPSDPERLPGA
jgi:hypothetical protein